MASAIALPENSADAARFATPVTSAQEKERLVKYLLSSLKAFKITTLSRRRVADRFNVVITSCFFQQVDKNGYRSVAEKNTMLTPLERMNVSDGSRRRICK